ncbi:MAG: 50S ribosomal protein L9 [Myxococcota bacterium]
MGKVKVILREDMPKLGDAGDVVEVKPGYARNYLIPQGIALPATAARVNEIEHHRRIIAERQAALLKDLKAAATKIRAMDLSFEAHAGDAGKLFGSITPAMIAARIAEQGIELDRRKIQSEPIKSVGEHAIKIRLQKELVVDVKIQVTAAAAPDADADADALLAEEPEPIGFGSMDEY